MGELRVIEQREGEHPYTLSPFHEPVATVRAGERVVVRTLDSYGNRITSASQKITDHCRPPFVNPVTGPIHVEGAEPGDALRVTLHEVAMDRDYAVTALVPGFGGLTGTDRTALLHAPLPEVVRIMPIRGGRAWFHEGLGLPLAPFVGTIGVAPEIEAISSLVPDRHGGNLDCVETAAGRTIVLPVNVPGGRLFVGDAHATQGDGELTGVAAEVPARVTLSVAIDKGRAPGWPRIESDAELMATGSARPLEDAARIACRELIAWLAADYGWDELEAYQLFGQAGSIRMGNMVDPNYTVVAKLGRGYAKAVRTHP